MRLIHANQCAPGAARHAESEMRKRRAGEIVRSALAQIFLGNTAIVRMHECVRVEPMFLGNSGSNVPHDAFDDASASGRYRSEHGDIDVLNKRKYNVQSTNVECLIV